MPRLRRLYLVAFWAAGFDMMSTVGGINVLSWGCGAHPLQFCESNVYVRALFPYVGIFAPVVYWPLEALFVVCLGAGFYACAAWVVRFAANRQRWVKHPERVAWFWYIACYVPLAAAAFNVLISWGILRP